VLGGGYEGGKNRRINFVGIDYLLGEWPGGEVQHRGRSKGEGRNRRGRGELTLDGRGSEVHLHQEDEWCLTCMNVVLQFSKRKSKDGSRWDPRWGEEKQGEKKRREIKKRKKKDTEASDRYRKWDGRKCTARSIDLGGETRSSGRDSWQVGGVPGGHVSKRYGKMFRKKFRL